MKIYFDSISEINNCRGKSLNRIDKCTILKRVGIREMKTI